jgi:hypothetical protein
MLIGMVAALITVVYVPCGACRLPLLVMATAASAGSPWCLQQLCSWPVPQATLCTCSVPSSA